MITCPICKAHHDPWPAACLTELIRERDEAQARAAFAEGELSEAFPVTGGPAKGEAARVVRNLRVALDDALAEGKRLKAFIYAKHWSRYGQCVSCADRAELKEKK
jgi:hypothetical protein